MSKPQPTRSAIPWLPVAVITVAALAAGVWLSGALDGRMTSDQTPPIIRSGTLIPEPRQLHAFTLSDHLGKPFDQGSLVGQWTLLAFGYTHCPDVCPTMLTLLAEVQRRLDSLDIGQEIQFVFVSIDPERDTAEELAAYLPYFGGRFLGVTGAEPELQRLTGQLGILYAKVEDAATALLYLMDHSASLILVNPAGQFQAIFSAPHDPQTLTQDLQQIVAYYRESEPG